MGGGGGGVGRARCHCFLHEHEVAPLAFPWVRNAMPKLCKLFGVLSTSYPIGMHLWEIPHCRVPCPHRAVVVEGHSFLPRPPTPNAPAVAPNDGAP